MLYKHFLPAKLICVEYLHECINFELRFGRKVFKFLSLYRLPIKRETILKS